MNSEKVQETIKRNSHAKKVQEQEIVKEIQEQTKEMLLPAIKEKSEEVAKYIEETCKNDRGLTSTQILPLIAKRSISDIATAGSKTYTAQELGIAFNFYIDMIEKINKYTKFPASKGTFCMLLGISTVTYNNYLQDPEKCEIMRIIDDYITNSILTSAQLGELREITSMFSLKAQHGFVEAQAPTVIEYKKKVDVDDIQAQLAEMKKGKIIDANYEE